MSRPVWLAVVLVVGCSSNKRESAPSAGASSLANAAAKLPTTCPLIPADLVKKWVPGAGSAQDEQFAKRCSYYGDKAALAIQIDPSPPPDPKDGEPVTGIGNGGIIQHLSPQQPGDTYVTISLGSDDKGNHYNLHAEVNGLGKDHKDDALELARAVIAQLH